MSSPRGMQPSPDLRGPGRGSALLPLAQAALASQSSLIALPCLHKTRLVRPSGHWEVIVRFSLPQLRPLVFFDPGPVATFHAPIVSVVAAQQILLRAQDGRHGASQKQSGELHCPLAADMRLRLAGCATLTSARSAAPGGVSAED